MINLLRKTKLAFERKTEVWRLRNFYTDIHRNLDVDLHLQKATDWLKRAQDSGSDRGVSYGTPFGKSFLSSYPETTGYIIPTFLALADYYGDRSYFNRAVEMGDWEIAIQMDSGAVMGGRVDTRPKTPAVFNTGMVLLGWADLLARTKEARFRNAGILSADWLTAIQESDGSWRHGNSQFAKSTSTVYNVKAAWGLCRFGIVCGEKRYVEASLRNARYAIRHQLANGWFANCCLTDPECPLLHTLAYAMQGVLEVGLLTNSRDMIQSAQKTADALIEAMDDEGFLPGRFYPDFSGAVNWCCLTGSAQSSIVWSTLYSLTKNPRYQEAAFKINTYLMCRHDITSNDPAIRGGLAGSWPVWGDYGRLMVLNWSTKFFVDTLIAVIKSDKKRADVSDVK